MKGVTVAHLLFALVHIVGVCADGQCLSRLDNNVNYINKDIRKPATGVSSASACCALCVKEKGCTVYSYLHEKKLCRFRNSTSGRREQTGMSSGYTTTPPPLPPTPPLATPNARQLEFMELEFTQFMHFGIPTFWDPPKEYLYGNNPTYHDCGTTTIDHSNQTGSYYPCLDPNVFHPTDLNADDWMEASAALGMKEIISLHTTREASLCGHLTTRITPWP